MIELRQLRHFIAVVEHGNFSAAAEHVFVSQSALTRSIQHLEQSLGAALLTRGARRTVPTAAGDRLFAYARMILQDCSDAAEEVRVIQAGLTGEVTFGFDSIFAFQFLDAALLRANTQIPGVALRAVEAPEPELLTAVEEGRLDFALVRIGEGAPLSRRLRFEPLMTIDTVLVAGRAHRLARQRSIAPQDLLGTRWMVLEDPLCLEVHEQFFSMHRIPPTRAVRTNSLTLILDQVMHGDALALLPEPVVRRQLRHKLLRRLEAGPPAPQGRHRAGLVVQSVAEPSAAISKVMDIVREIFAASENGS